MAVWNRILAVLVLATGVLAQQYGGYDFGRNIHRRIKRHTLGPYVVRNLASTDGDLPLRQEIRTLEDNTDQWTLYLLGLSMMQFTNQSDPLSWYQITGVLCLPRRDSPCVTDTLKESTACPSRAGITSVPPQETR
jgi:tyrosinase